MKRILARTGGAALAIALGCQSPANSEQVENLVPPGSTLPEGYRVNLVYSFNSQSIDGFLNAMNGVNWKDGAKRNFFNPRNCTVNRRDNSGRFFCNADMDETSAIGNRRCANIDIMYSPKKLPYTYLSTIPHGLPGKYYTESGSEETYRFYGVKEELCTKWKEVTAEPPKEKTPEPSAPPLEVRSDQITRANRPGTITLNRNGAIFAGILIASVSCLIGFLMGRSSKRDDGKSGFTYM